jgi:hypothetical protein
MDNLLSIVSKYSTNEQEQTAQTALFTIKLLAKRLAEKHPEEFSSVSFLIDLKSEYMTLGNVEKNAKGII